MLPLAVMTNVAVPALTELNTLPEYLQLTKVNVAELEALGTKTPALLKLASVVATRFGFGFAEGAAASPPPPQAASKAAALWVSKVLKEVFMIFLR